MNSAAPDIRAFFDEATSTVTYLVADAATHEAAVIDPVLDYDHRSGKVGTASADAVLAAAHEAGLRITWVLETHAHADHLSAAPWIRRHTGARVGIGERIREVQALFRPVFNLHDLPGDGHEFDQLFADGHTLHIGSLPVQVLHTPGHTPACVAYLVAGGDQPDAVFVGDTLFMPDYGSARADFPGGSAQALYRSIQRLLALPGDTRLFMCHDYKAPGRDHVAWQSSVAEQRRANVHVHEGITEEAFVAMRSARDATLPAPVLLLPSLQVNLRAGHFPAPEDNGVRYLKIPLRMAPALSDTA